VSSGGNSYVCIQAHSNQAVGNATAYWNIMSSKGTNGTDGTDGTHLTSTLSARGDLVFKGASALTRLPKGTAGYYLKQGANDPEWGVVSGGDVVKLATVNVSASSTIVIDGNGSWVDNSVYGSYVFIIQNLSTSNDSGNSEVFWRMNTGGSQFSSTAYYSFVTSTSGGSGSSTVGSTKRWADLSWGLSHNNMDSEAHRTGYGKIEILNTGGGNTGGPGNYYVNQMTDFISHHSNSSSIYRMSQMGWLASNASLFSGITIFPTGGTIDDGIITVYGRKR
jgi:hypothetical protein